MEIKSDSLIRHPLDVVFRAYRDRLPEVAGYIPDIREIIVKKREEEGGIVNLHNEWVTDRDIPKFARKFVKPEWLRWDDFAEWNADEYHCHWRIYIPALGGAVKCGGTNEFVDTEEGTLVLLRGNLEIDLKRVPGIPRLLAGSIGPKVESFIVSLITPNLKQVNQSLESYLDDQ